MWQTKGSPRTVNCWGNDFLFLFAICALWIMKCFWAEHQCFIRRKMMRMIRYFLEKNLICWNICKTFLWNLLNWPTFQNYAKRGELLENQTTIALFCELQFFCQCIECKRQCFMPMDIAIVFVIVCAMFVH